jgi:hypothetical protein
MQRILSRRQFATLASITAIAGLVGGAASGSFFASRAASANNTATRGTDNGITSKGNSSTTIQVPQVTNVNVPSNGVQFSKPDGTVVAALNTDGNGNTTFDLFGGGNVDGVRFTAGTTGGKVEVLAPNGVSGVTLNAVTNTSSVIIASGASNPSASITSNNGNGYGGQASLIFGDPQGHGRQATSMDTNGNVTPYAWSAGHGDGITVSLLDKLIQKF